MRNFLSILLLLLSNLVFGQFQKLINQSIEIKSATKVQVDLQGEVIYQEWEGSFLLIETKVVIENCNENIFKAFVQSGRYLTAVDNDGDLIKLTSHEDLGQVVKSRLGETYEDVYFKIYYPKGFKDQSGNLLVSSVIHEQENGSN